MIIIPAVDPFWQKGRDAFWRGDKLYTCPYMFSSAEGVSWVMGWASAERTMDPTIQERNTT